MTRFALLPWLLLAFSVAPSSAADAPGQQPAWRDLADIIQQIPPPPQTVSEAQRYRREVAQRLQALERQLDAYERRLEQADSEIEKMQEAGVRQALQAARDQGRAAQRRLDAQQENPGAPRDAQRDRAETEAMRATLPNAFPDFASQDANAAVMSYAMQSASRGMREEQEVERLEHRWQAEDERCDDSESCVKAAELSHLQRLIAFKDDAYKSVTRDWGDLRDEVAERAAPFKRGLGQLVDKGEWLLDKQVEGHQMVLNKLAQSMPVRWLVGVFGMLLGESQTRWEEADNLREQVEQAQELGVVGGR